MADRSAGSGQLCFAGARRERIAELVLRNGVVLTSELSRLCDVSEVTIRHDLEFLARQGLLVRERGGAIAKVTTPSARGFDQRSELTLDAMRRIGAHAARLVEPGDTIIMDAGTTVMEMATSLRQIAPLTVVTTALNVASMIGRLPGCHVILMCGSFSVETNSTVGPLVERDLRELVVNKLFLGAHTVDLDVGVVDTSMEVARVKRAMAEVAREVILLADSSKWQSARREAFVRVVPLTAIHRIISDSGLPDDVQSALERLRIDLSIV